MLLLFVRGESIACRVERAHRLSRSWRGSWLATAVVLRLRVIFQVPSTHWFGFVGRVKSEALDDVQSAETSCKY